MDELTYLSLAGSLFDYKRYKEAEEEAHLAIENYPRMSVESRERADGLIRTSSLVGRIENGDGSDGMTNQLTAGWYRKCIQSLIDGERLEKIASVPIPLDTSIEDCLHETEYAIKGFESFVFGMCHCRAHWGRAATRLDR